METWGSNPVLLWSLLALLLSLGLPGPLWAGTPGYNRTDPVTDGFYSYYSAGTDGASGTENGVTSTSSSSESLSPSQRDLLLTHTVHTHAVTPGSLEMEETEASTEKSSSFPENSNLSTGPLRSSSITTTDFSKSSSSGSISSIGSIISSSSSSSSSGSIINSSSSDSTSSSSSGSIISSSSSSSDSTSSSSSGSIISSSSSSSDSTSSSSSGSIISSSSSSNDSTSSSSSGSIINSSSSSTGSTSSSSSSSGSISSSSSGSIISSSSSGSISSSSSSTSISGFTNTNQMPLMSHSVSTEDKALLFSKDETLPQDSPDTTLRLGDATASMSQTDTLTGRTYTTTISRAGERTLLSVTTSSENNSTSSAFTEDLDSHHPPSTWGIPPRPAETEGYTPATRTNGRETTEQHMTETLSETGSPSGARRTVGLTGQPNATKHQLSLTSQEISDSTPPLRVTEPSTDQSETPVSSTPPLTSHAEGTANASGTHRDSGSSAGPSTEITTGAHSPTIQNQEGSTAQTSEDSVGLGLTTVASSVSSSSEMRESQTDVQGMITGVFLTTASVTVTERLQTTEESSFELIAFTTATTASTAPPLPATSDTMLSSASSSYTKESATEATLLSTSPSFTVPTRGLHTSAVLPTVQVSPSQTQRPSTKMIPTKASTVQTETTGTQRLPTTQSQYIKTTYSHSTPGRSTKAEHTTWKQTDGRATELEVTTVPIKVQTARVPQRNPCVSNPCLNGGMCVSYKGPEFTCQCPKAWTGPTCDQDMDECEQDPCPTGSTCVNTKGSFSCECPIGYDLEDGRTCTRAKTFLGIFNFNRHDRIKSSVMHEIQREIIQLLNVSLSVLQGYSRSTLSRREQGGVHILAVNMFSVSTDVTTTEVYNSIQMSLNNCSSSLTHCRMVLQHQLSYHMESLCEAQKTQCDTERSICADSSGTAYCQCLQGYYKHNPEDLSCLECRDGYKLENGTCVPCTFGFGGFNCANFYKLIAVVVVPAGGALLLILIVALIITCCKKDKNDINKIIFKSGDMQMSPYADFPKNNRISMEWGRETIEMQENGSTKNLLQMTDIYYSPALRNSDLERNGLYPFTGLPGSRHSCIYPAQWNPSFISDDSRRRDYF